eukprot:4894637-Pyramimonas_sp.AAC.1
MAPELLTAASDASGDVCQSSLPVAVSCSSRWIFCFLPGSSRRSHDCPTLRPISKARSRPS